MNEINRRSRTTAAIHGFRTGSVAGRNDKVQSRVGNQTIGITFLVLIPIELILTVGWRMIAATDRAMETVHLG